MFSSKKKISQKNPVTKRKPRTWTCFFDMLHMTMRFCTSGSSSNSPDRHGNQNQNELGNFPQGTKETEKARQNLPTNVMVLLLPGVLLIERILYVGRRGKPSTWLPRQKLAEERIIQPKLYRKNKKS